MWKCLMERVSHLQFLWECPTLNPNNFYFCFQESRSKMFSVLPSLYVVQEEINGWRRWRRKIHIIMIYKHHTHAHTGVIVVKNPFNFPQFDTLLKLFLPCSLSLFLTKQTLYVNEKCIRSRFCELNVG